MYNTHAVRTNTVVFSYTSGSVAIILERIDDTPSSTWRLPTAPVPSTDTSLSALENHLYVYTGIKASEVTYQEQLYTTEYLDGPTSSMCVSYIHVARETAWHKGKGHIGLFPLSSLPKLTNSDRAIIAYAEERLRAKAVYTNIIALLLPAQFSLAMFQDAYETLTKRSVDRRNFRKKIIGLDFLKRTKLDKKITANTPLLYTSSDTSLRVLERPL